MKNNLISTHVNGYFAGNYSRIEAVPANKTVCSVFYDGKYPDSFFDGEKWVETLPTPEEIEEANKPKIPEVVTRRQFKIALAVLGYNENNILDGINQLTEPNKTIARISYTESGTFERHSQDLIFVAKSFLNLTDQQIDEVFLTGINF